MTIETATPSGATVDAPASMDSVLAEFETGAPADATDEVVSELVEDAKAGQADEAAEPEGDETDASEEAEEGDTDAEKQEDEPEPTHRVKVNGEEVDVPLSELLKGYSRTADYTAKTQAIAEERKAVETRAASLDGEYAEKLKNNLELFTRLDPILSEAAKIDWQTLAQEDPAGYVQLRAAVDDREKAIKSAQGEIDRVQRETAQREQAAFDTSLADTEKAIRALDPGFADDAKFSGFVDQGVKELASIGLDGDDLKAVLSSPKVAPAVFSLMADARRWREQQKAAATLSTKKVVPVSTARPLKTDASANSAPPRKRLSPNASRDQRVAHVLDQFMQE